MTLRILKSNEPLEVKNICIAIYSNPGLGKSTLGFSATDAILLDFDGGAARAVNRGDSVQVATWDDVANITDADLAPFSTVVIDTVGRALDFLTADIIRRNPKHGRGGALTLPGYGALKSEFTGWLKGLRTMGKDVVLIAHSSEDKNGDDLLERLDVQGGSKQEIYKSADAMGRLSLVNSQRMLNFSPTDTSFGKNPANLKPLPVPEISTAPGYLGEVIATIKAALNRMTDEQKNRMSIIADWQATIAGLKTVEDFNAMIPEIDKADKALHPTIKGMLHEAATAAGFTGNKKTKQYEKVEG